MFLDMDIVCVCMYDEVCGVLAELCHVGCVYLHGRVEHT